MSQQSEAYARYIAQFEHQANPEVYGGYGKNIGDIAFTRRVEITARNVMDTGVCLGAFTLPDGRAVEARQTENGQPRWFVFASVEAYQSYIRPMSFNQYHEF